MTLYELMQTMTHEQKLRMKNCDSPEDILELAGRENLLFTQEMAEEIFSMLHPPAGELSDSELEAVAGGAEDGEGKNTCPVRDICAMQYRFLDACAGCDWRLYDPDPKRFMERKRKEK